MKTAIGAMILACALAPALPAQPVNGVAAPPNPSNPTNPTPGTGPTIGTPAPVSPTTPANPAAPAPGANPNADFNGNPVLSSGTGAVSSTGAFGGAAASSGTFGGTSGTVTAEQRALISVQNSLQQVIAPNGVNPGLSGPSGGGANGIGLTISGGRIIMTGTVHTEEQRQTLGARANAAANGVPVVNQLQLR